MTTSLDIVLNSLKEVKQELNGKIEEQKSQLETFAAEIGRNQVAAATEKAPEIKSLGDALYATVKENAEEIKAAIHNDAGVTLEVKAAKTIDSSSGSSIGSAGIATIPGYELGSFHALTQTTTDVRSLVYSRYMNTGNDDGGSIERNELAAYTNISPNLTPITAIAQPFGAVTSIAEEALDLQGVWSTTIATYLQRNIHKYLDGLTILGNQSAGHAGNWEGLRALAVPFTQPTGANISETILAAKTAAATSDGYVLDAVLVNPVTFQALVNAKSDIGTYLAGEKAYLGDFGNTVHGLTIVQTNFLADNEFILLDSRQSALHWVSGLQLKVQAAGDSFLKGQVYARLGGQVLYTHNAIGSARKFTYVAPVKGK